MRHGSLLCAFVVAILLRPFTACTQQVGPGDECAGSILADVHCPAGYTCSDRNQYRFECVRESSSSSYDSSRHEGPNAEPYRANPPPYPDFDSGSSVAIEADAAGGDASSEASDAHHE